MNNSMQFTLIELCEATHVSARNVRYYIQQGLVDRPNGAGRGAWYGGNHAEQLIVIKRLRDEGLSLERIRELLHSKGPGALPPLESRGGVEVWSHVHVKQGIELHIQPGKASLSPGQLRLLREKLLEALDDMDQQKE